MNSTQRKYLVDKITEKVKQKIKDLESNKAEIPTIEAYLMHEILSDRFVIKSNDELKDIIRSKALAGLSNKKPETFLSQGNSWSSNYGKNEIVFKVEEFFILPESYKKALDDARKTNDEIKEKCMELRIQSESLETRIMLASDRTLQKMINEVDDMGDISLIDTKIKLLE